MRWVHGPPTSPGFWLTFFPGHPDRILNVQDGPAGLSAWLPRSVVLNDRESRGEAYVRMNALCLQEVSCRRIEVPDTLPEYVF